MSTIIGWLIERDERKLFTEEEPSWALTDPEYKVKTLVEWDDSLEVKLAEVTEDMILYQSLCELLEEENRQLKEKVRKFEEE